MEGGREGVKVDNITNDAIMATVDEREEEEKHK